MRLFQWFSNTVRTILFLSSILSNFLKVLNWLFIFCVVFLGEKDLMSRHFMNDSPFSHSIAYFSKMVFLVNFNVSRQIVLQNRRFGVHRDMFMMRLQISSSFSTSSSSSSLGFNLRNSMWLFTPLSPALPTASFVWFPPFCRFLLTVGKGKLFCPWNFKKVWL